MKPTAFSTRTRSALLFCTLSILLIATPGNAVDGKALRGADEMIAFADSLFHSGSLYRATMEYQRFLYFYPTHPDIPRARFNLATGAKRAGNYSFALACYSSLTKEYPGTSTAIKASFEEAQVLHLMRNYPAARNHYADFLARYPDHPLAEEATRALANMKQPGAGASEKN